MQNVIPLTREEFVVECWMWMLLASAPTLLLSNHLSFSAKKYLYHCMKVDVIQPENLQAISLVELRKWAIFVLGFFVASKTNTTLWDMNCNRFDFSLINWHSFAKFLLNNLRSIQKRCIFRRSRALWIKNFSSPLAPTMVGPAGDTKLSTFEKYYF